MSGVTFTQAVSPTSWGYQPGNLSTANAQTTFAALDVADKVSIGVRSAVGGFSASRAVAAVVQRSAAQVAEGGTAISTGGLIARSIGGTLRRSLLVSGLVSAVTNVYHAVTGSITPTRAAGNVVADTAVGVGGGLAAAATAGLVAGAMGAAPGILLAGATFLAGTAAYMGIEALARVSGVHQGISDGATGLVERIINYFKGRMSSGGV